uniref:Late endosomal/lysosomal adaptor and MAPK and MTOR activator 4 n=2 Tax=Schistocephalus solidus TaxID=70667 RepID=A0A183TQ92_SCHSO
LPNTSSLQRPTQAVTSAAYASASGAFVPSAASTSAASLSALSKIPGWRGTLVLSPDGAVLQSAGELINTEALGSKFAALAHRVGQFFALQSNRADGFKRLSIMSSGHAYLMTCTGDAIYVVKRELSPETANQGPPLVDLQQMDGAMRV